MTRIILSIDPHDKSWLERRAKEKNVSMSEVVRQAVRRMRDADQESIDRVLSDTRGIWRSGDGLRYQRRLRLEWK